MRDETDEMKSFKREMYQILSEVWLHLDPNALASIARGAPVRLSMNERDHIVGAVAEVARRRYGLPPEAQCTCIHEPEVTGDAADGTQEVQHESSCLVALAQTLPDPGLSDLGTEFTHQVDAMGREDAIMPTERQPFRLTDVPRSEKCYVVVRGRPTYFGLGDKPSRDDYERARAYAARRTRKSNKEHTIMVVPIDSLNAALVTQYHGVVATSLRGLEKRDAENG